MRQKWGGADVTVATKVKGTKKLTGLAIKLVDANIAPTIYLNDMYENNLSVAEAAGEVINIYEDHKPSADIDVNFFSNFEAVKEKVIFKLIPLKSALLMADESNVAYKAVLDNLAKVYIVPVITEVAPIGAISITENHIKLWGASVDEIDKYASENIGKTEASVINLGEMFNLPGELPANVITNSSKMYGAALMLSDSIMDEQLKSQGVDKLYILPCSVHEIIVMPDIDGFDARDFLELVKMVNSTEVSDEDFLANNVYTYTKAIGLQIAA